MSTHYSHAEKVSHLLRWAAGWNGDTAGESMWSYSLGLGGSHALLNGWFRNSRIRQSLTAEERRLLEMALSRSTRRRR
ncbi:hypothetical protein [Streptomyces sp. NPDC018347]|uniref:hypothetical protein n=1 Tax=Streptomyces sp. NPDC018347 TaxID=3157193 RepID=UPI0033CFD99F